MTKLSKILKIVAAVAFLTALAVNIQVTLTDPFVGISEEAIATGTDTTTTQNTSGCNNCYATVIIKKCRWTTYEIEAGYENNPKGHFKTIIHTCTYCAYYCNEEKKGNCSSPDLCPQSEEEPS